VYLILNIVGTVYYVKINKRPEMMVTGGGTLSPEEKGWDLASVILGWIFMPILTISSPISYAVHKR
jgi:hypothetical protein